MIKHSKMFGFQVCVVGQPPGNERLKGGFGLEKGSVHRRHMSWIGGEVRDRRRGTEQSRMDWGDPKKLGRGRS